MAGTRCAAHLHQHDLCPRKLLLERHELPLGIVRREGGHESHFATMSDVLKDRVKFRVVTVEAFNTTQRGVLWLGSVLGGAKVVRYTAAC